MLVFVRTYNEEGDTIVATNEAYVHNLGVEGIDWVLCEGFPEEPEMDAEYNTLVELVRDFT
jgi:hypothetical protein